MSRSARFGLLYGRLPVSPAHQVQQNLSALEDGVDPDLLRQLKEIPETRVGLRTQCPLLRVEARATRDGSRITLLSGGLVFDSNVFKRISAHLSPIASLF